MDESIKKFYNESSGQPIDQYENSHKERFDFLVKDLCLDQIKESTIVDVGCGYGPIFKRLNQSSNKFIGLDGANLQDLFFTYIQTDLSYDYFSQSYFNVTNKTADYALCFETIEHLSNPYHTLIEIKKILKLDGICYLTIPHQSICHNTIYPGLIYPVQNFIVFLQQMAFEIKDYRQHDKCFKQEVFTLINKSWDKSKMIWENSDPKFKNISPLEFVNL